MLTNTTTALLEGLTDPTNQLIWRQFDDRFRPVLIALGRRLGLSTEDAADAAQETLTRFVVAYRAGHYDRARGRLRSWITGIARNCMIDLRADRAHRRERRGMSAIENLPDANRITAIWDDECEHEIIRCGMTRLREQSRTDERTIRAFELLAFGARTPSDVASELGMSMNDVYLAKHRCLTKLRAIIDDLKNLYEVA
ncbi:MAG: sigma-70 family RNA polymerase sigma factor [Phycisphaerales bacterium]|nr:sigma-70 family RNA polymerase sigma factor [Phycisphaerales bacterium]MCI0630164.1 sigma-70 family RNA polymerase sigma factor [Phycisphaerales bacterium]MCI0674364.1 sigma-70 family RNA polymerase sigma factor [Phycisphaerales bacterium]